MVLLRSLCRFCLANTEKDCTKILIKISDTQKCKFEEITRTELELSSEYPENVCTECSDHLENFHFFKQQLIRKQADLKCFLSQLGREACGNSHEALEAEETTEEFIETLINDDEVLLSDSLLDEGHDATSVVREELIYNETKPKLILTSRFLFARDRVRHPERVTSVLESPLIDVNEKVINKCDECGVTFLSLDELKLHRNDHNFVCKECSSNTIFKSKHSYETHMKEVHGRSFVCAGCGKVYYDKVSLNSHLRSHNEKTKYKCTYAECPKTFKYHHHLKNHLRVHSKESFNCDICNSAFRQKYALTLHQKKHAEKFLECNTCKSQFLRPIQLQRHQCDGIFKAYKTRKPKKKFSSPVPIN